MALRYTFRPLPAWPHQATPPREQRSSPFRSTWPQTLALLEREIAHRDGADVVMGVGLEPFDIRQDGQPRANARAFAHQGVEVSFEVGAWSADGNRWVKHREVYATDVCDDWKDNVRSIAMGLEALRAVDRYGITRKGEQYAGFAQLAAGGPDAERGRVLVERAGGLTEALKRHHPDLGGDARDFVDVQAYRTAMAAAAR